MLINLPTYVHIKVCYECVIDGIIFIIEKQLCYPNPCKNNGTCIETEENTFVCDCDGIGYTGKTCEVLLINAPEFSALSVNSEIEFTISSSPDREFTLRLISDDRKFLKVIPPYVTFSQAHTEHNITMKIKKTGKYTLKYRITDETLNYQPIPPATILVNNGTVNKSNYFSKYGVRPGILKSGCCSSEALFHIQCPSSAIKLFLKSTCGWIERETFYSPGIIFSSDNKFDMPIAIAGAKVRKQKSNINLLSLNKDEFENDCITCSNGSIGNVLESDVQAQCNIMPISLNDVQSFLCHESLASTYFSHSSKLTPKWLKLNALSSNRTHDMHSYMVDLVYPEDLKTMSGCSKLTTATDGIYSVMLYSGSLTVKIDKESVQLQTNKLSSFCFAVNLCEGKSSPLYIAIPDEAQTVLQSLKFMRDLENKGWTVTVSSLVISDFQIREIMNSVMVNSMLMYWNGKDFFKSYKHQPYMLTCVKFNKQFSINDTVKANWVFSGNVIWLHDNINKVRIYAHIRTYYTTTNLWAKSFCRHLIYIQT